MLVTRISQATYFASILIFFWALFIYSAFVGPTMQATGWFLYYVPIYYFGLILFLCVLKFIKQKTLDIYWWGFFLTLLYAIISIAVTLYAQPRISLQYRILTSGNGLQALVFAVLLPTLLTKNDARKFLKSIVLLMAMISVLCLVIYLTGVKQLFGFELSFNGLKAAGFERYCIFKNRNYTAAFTAWVPAAAGFLYFTESNRYMQRLWIFCGIIAVMLMSTTLSRGAQIGMIVSLIPVGFMMWRKNPRVLIWSLFLAMVFTLFVIFLHPFSFSKYLIKPFSPTGRVELWKAAFAQLRETAWLGGLGYHGFFPDNERIHNGFLSQWVHFGIFGLVSYLLMLIALIRRALSHSGKIFALQNPINILIFIIIGTLAQELVQDNLATSMFFTNFYFWTILGFIPVFAESKT